jgi:diguanylate cyclase (GGDEF)-like protein
MHSILKSQSARCRKPDGSVDVDQLMALVQTTYSQFERERARSEHATSQMIAEMEALDDARRMALETVKQEHLKLDIALEHMAHGLAMFDSQRRLVVSNGDYNRLIGHEDKAADRLFDDDLARLNQLIDTIDGPLDDIAGLMAEGGAVECTARLHDGRVLTLGFQPVQGGGWVQVVRDVSRQKQSDDQILYMATHDVLTGLANRTVFNDAVSAALDPAAPHGTAMVYFLDLDRFKSVNDTLGHLVGDSLLCQVAKRLKRATPKDAVVARLGGDEFALIVVPAPGPDTCQSLADTIVEDLSQPYAVEGHSIVIGVSIGFAAAPADGATPSLIMRNADIALYRAKSAGRGTSRRFERGMEQQILARRDMELGLRFALDRREFVLFYQPQFDLRSGRIDTVEALIRWNHPTRGLILPTDFIGVTEEIGLIVDIGEWTIRQACADAQDWPADIKVALNLSPRQFNSERLFPTISAALSSTGLAAARLELEVTETALISDADQAFELLNDLRHLGISIAMDDFGTGYGSLSHLRRFPFSKLKIDRAFVAGLTADKDSAAIVRTIVDLAHSFGMTVTAEGVETDGQMSLLQSMDCDQAQGFLLAEPMSQAALMALLRDRRTQSGRPVALYRGTAG